MHPWTAVLCTLLISGTTRSVYSQQNSEGHLTKTRRDRRRSFIALT